MSDQLDTQQPETSPAETDQSNPGLFGISANLFTAPTQAFEGIKQVGAGWFPMLVLMILSVGSTFLYFDVIDFDWMIQQLVDSATIESTPAERDMVEKQFGSMSNTMFMIMGMASSLIMIPLMFAIMAVVYIIISNIRNDNLTYGQCFNLVAWSSLVKVVSVFVGIATMLMTDNGQIGQHDVNGLNLNLLIFDLPVTNPWYGWLTQFDLIGLWSAFLIGVGYRVFTKASMTASMIIGFLPTILYFGIYALIV